MIIGFTENTSKFISKLLCKRFRHCVVIFDMHDNGYILAQIATDGIKMIPIGIPELEKLKSSGWVFVNASIERANHKRRFSLNILSCVGFAKRAMGIHHPFIWTPDALYRYLTK